MSHILTGKTLLAATVALGLSWGMSAQAQTTAKSGGAALSAEDRAGIDALLANYQRFLSTCASKEYSELFTPDGVFISDDFRGKKHFELYGKSATLKGRPKLVELVETEEFCMDPAKRAERAARTSSGGGGGRSGGRQAPPPVFEATADGAKGTIPNAAGGRYEDVYVKTQEGWRFKSRSVFMPPPAPAAPAASTPAR